MKTIFLLWLGCFSFSLFGQEVTAIKMKVYNAECVPESPSSPALEVSIYIMPQDTLIFQTSQNSSTGEITDEALLSPGRYLARYKNLVGQPMEREIVLGDKDTAIGFCMDSLKTYPLNTLAQLKDKDSLIVQLSATPCFGPVERRIQIVCNDDRLTASYYMNTFEELENDMLIEKDSLVQTVVMDEHMKTAFMRFENELSQARDNENESMTDVEFNMRSPYLHLYKKNTFGRWGGFGNFIDVLFPREEKTAE